MGQQCSVEYDNFEPLRMGQSGIECEQFKMGQGHPEQMKLDQIVLEEMHHQNVIGNQHDLDTMKKLLSNPNIPMNMFLECNQLEPLKPMVVEVNALTTAELSTIENEIGYVKLPQFTQMKEKYQYKLDRLKDKKTNQMVLEQQWNAEIAKKPEERDKKVIELYSSIKDDIKNIEKEIDEIETSLKSIQSKDSPFQISELSIPTLFGTEDTPSFKKLQCVPNVDSNNSIRDVWSFLVEIGRSLNVSKRGYERALWTKLDSEK